MTEMEQQCRTLLERFDAHVGDITEGLIGERLTVHHKLTIADLGSRAGVCRYRRGPSLERVVDCEVRINSQLATVAPDEVADTLAHEFAHAIVETMRVWKGHRRKGLWSSHGAIWRMVMRTLGYQPSRCHTLDLKPTRRERRWVYEAACGTRVRVSTTLHNRIQKGQVRTVRRTGGRIARGNFVGPAEVQS